MQSSQFAEDLQRRVREARAALATATAEGDFYAADVRTNELDSLLRLAMEHGLVMDTDLPL